MPVDWLRKRIGEPSSTVISEIFAAVLQEVGRGGASGHRVGETGELRAEADLGEFSVLKITEQQGPLGIGHTKRVLVYLRIHMPVGDENVLPAIVVEDRKTLLQTQGTAC